MKATESEWVEASEDEDEEDDEDDSENDDNSEGSKESDDDDSDEDDLEVQCILYSTFNRTIDVVILIANFLVAQQNIPCFFHFVEYPFIIILNQLLYLYFLLHLHETLLCLSCYGIEARVCPFFV